MRAVLSLLLVFCFALTAAADWPGVPYTEIRAYAWPIDQNEEEVILPGLKLRPKTLPHAGVVLSADQRARLLAAQKRRKSERPRAGCYVPHNAFVFYDQEKPVAFIEICFDCLGARVLPEDQECDPDFLALGKICDELKLPFGQFKTYQEFRARTAPILGR